MKISATGDSLGSLIEGQLASFIKKNAAAAKNNSGTKKGDLRPMTARQIVTNMVLSLPLIVETYSCFS